MGRDRPHRQHRFPDRKRIKYHWGDSYPGSVDGPVHPPSEFQASNVDLIMADRVNAVGSEVRARLRWNGTYQEWGGGSIQADGHCSWAFVREGDTWKIRRDTWNITPGTG